MQIEVNQFFKKFLPASESMRAESLQKARMKIDKSAFTDLIEESLTTL